MGEYEIPNAFMMHANCSICNKPLRKCSDWNVFNNKIVLLREEEETAKRSFDLFRGCCLSPKQKPVSECIQEN